MKGIILSGGKGTRLFPITFGLSKQLLPVYNKPMIYYPLSTLMLAGIREIMVITSPSEQPQYKRFLRGGAQWGVSFTYAEQAKPKGLAEAFIIAKDFIKDDDVCLILGDNIFYGDDVGTNLQGVGNRNDGATVFAYMVRDPERYGVIELDEFGFPVSIEEKPKKPKSNYAVPGLYFFDSKVSELAEKVKPSARGELEITSLIDWYLKHQSLQVHKLSRGTAWLDAGTHESLMEASNFIQTIENRTGLLVGSPEEVAYRKGYINKKQFMMLASELEQNSYGKSLMEFKDMHL